MIFWSSASLAQQKYFRAMSDVHTEEDAQKLIQKHPKWEVSIIQLTPADSLNQPTLYNMAKDRGVHAFDGKAYKVLEEKKKVLMVKYEATEPKRKKKYDY